jgi:leucine-rich repeat protein SHOC2
MSGLGKLKVLHMGQTRVQTLPEDFGKLGSLIELNLQECESLKSLPDNFGLLSELQKLVMHHNKSFVKLPEGFGRLQALVELDLGTCSIEEKGLSSDFGKLSALRTLCLQYNKLATLPETFRDLGALVFLEMHRCPNLIDVQALPWNLEHMDIGNCPNLTDIPFLGKMSLLKCLILCNCTRLTQLQGLESLPSLVEINVAGCTMLENVSGLNHNRALQQCYLSGSKISMKYDDDWLKVSEVDFHYLWINVLLIEHNGGMLIHNLPQVPQYLINRSNYITKHNITKQT